MNPNPATSRTLELTVLSAEDLRVDRKPVTKNLYVVVRAESLTSYTTNMVAEGGGGSSSYPSWNQKFLVDLPMHARCITFEVKCKSSMGVKDVGVARIAVSDFLGGVVPDHCLQFLSYRLRDWEGRRNGVISFSVRVKTPEYAVSSGTIPEKATVTVMPEKMGSCGFQMRAPTSNSSSGVVTGIPVWWNSSASHV